MSHLPGCPFDQDVTDEHARDIIMLPDTIQAKSTVRVFLAVTLSKINPFHNKAMSAT